MKHPKELIQVSGNYPDLKIVDHGCWGYRHQAFLSLLDEMFQKFGSFLANRRLEFNFYSGDRAENALEFLHEGKVFANNTTRKLKGRVLPIPDFLYTHGHEVGIDDWETVIAQCKQRSMLPYEYDQCFWIGDANNHPSRGKLLKLSRKFPQYIKAKPMSWNYNEPGSGMSTKDGINAASHYVPIPDHAKYKYLIDVPGIGYSSRLKLIMQLRRPVFIAERDYEEFFFPFMVPDQHYIPVKKNLGDLVRKIRLLERNADTYHMVIRETEKFAQKYLSKEFALEHLFTMIMEHGSIKN